MGGWLAYGFLPGTVSEASTVGPARPGCKSTTSGTGTPVARLPRGQRLRAPQRPNTCWCPSNGSLSLTHLQCPSTERILARKSVRGCRRGGRAAKATQHERMKIAVVGSGLAGLHVAWLLSCPEHFPPGHPLAATGAEVHLFERAPAIGFDAHSVDVCGGRGRVDVPMRGFYVSYYPRLATLYRTAGVQYARRYGGNPTSWDAVPRAPSLTNHVQRVALGRRRAPGTTHWRFSAATRHGHSAERRPSLRTTCTPGSVRPSTICVAAVRWRAHPTAG